MSFVSLTQHLLRASTQRFLTLVPVLHCQKKDIHGFYPLKQDLPLYLLTLLWDMVMMPRVFTGIQVLAMRKPRIVQLKRLVFTLLVSWA